jgi:hypothetical protein
MATDDDPAKRLKKGFDVMWRVAQSVSGELKEELARRDFAKDVDDAGRGLLRTASGVVDEVKKNLDRSGLGPKIEGAGREVFRATADVVVRLGAELEKRAAERPAEVPQKDDAGSDPGFRAASPGEDDDHAPR